MRLPCLIRQTQDSPLIESDTLINPMAIDSIERCMSVEDYEYGNRALDKTRICTRGGDAHLVNMHVDEFVKAYESWMSS